MPDPAPNYDGWPAVFQAFTDYEAEIVRDRLGAAGLEAVVLTTRDHAFNLTHGALARVYVLVPPDQEAEAVALLAESLPDDDALARAALGLPEDAPLPPDDDDAPPA